MFLVGVGGLLVAAVAAAVADGVLRAAGSDGEVARAFFIAVAALAPVLALGLLVQMIVALAGRAQAMVKELGRFEAETTDESVELGDESYRRQRDLWEGVRYFPEVLLPFVVGLAVQFFVTEAVAIYAVAADVGSRAVALGLGLEVVALLAYLLLFGPLVTVLARMRTQPAGS